MRSLIIVVVIALVAVTFASTWAGKLATFHAGAMARTERSSTPASAGARTGERPRGEAAATAAVYKWRDARGVTHFESQPPPPGVAAQVIEMITPRPLPANRSAPAGVPAPAETQSSLAEQPWSVYLPGGSDDFFRQLDRTLGQIDVYKRTLERLDNDL